MAVFSTKLPAFCGNVTIARWICGAVTFQAGINSLLSAGAPVRVLAALTAFRSSTTHVQELSIERLGGCIQVGYLAIAPTEASQVSAG